MIRRYLYNPEIRLTSYQEGEDGFHPWLAVYWTALDDNLDKGYDLIREILFETRFDDPDKLLKQIQTIQAAYRNGIDQNIEDLMLNRAFARRVNAVAQKLLTGRRVYGITNVAPNFFGTGSRGRNKKLIRASRIRNHFLKNKFRHWTTANIPVADEHNFYHFLKLQSMRIYAKICHINYQKWRFLAILWLLPRGISWRNLAYRFLQK
jgi:Zn-dependent M16 (insulinase) family peptidase